jgi:hypothetical protein
VIRSPFNIYPKKFSKNKTFAVENGILNNEEVQITEKTRVKEPITKTEFNLQGVLKEGDTPWSLMNLFLLSTILL